MKILATVRNIVPGYPNDDDILSVGKSCVIEVNRTNTPPCVREYLEKPENKQISFTLLEEE